ncbi:hypothetical protein [Halopiger goleimassiliensis]|uniref:hypothetical protein n=1 Tax=Halopiger goleimassiliensis TaxID=1293048 RepID=UPI0006775C30|nr:hypothetical protein [Halopiger goleimassiliensis]
MALPVEVLLGIYLGLLTGIVPALVAGSLGFVVRYFSGVTLPGFGVVVLSLSIASVQGGLLGLVEPTISQSPRLLVAVLVVLMLSLYAHNQGDKLGATLPHRLSLTSLRQRTLSTDVVELVGTVGRVTVRPTGEIRDVEGYPPLPADLRRTLREGSWRLPADLPLSELESRLEERLRTDHDLADVQVSIDERARATITAAPPSGGLSRRIPSDRQAVTLSTLVPTGLARGDEVTVRTGDRSIDGTVVSVRTELDERRAEEASPPSVDEETELEDGHATTEPIATKSTQTSAGGVGRVTVSVPRRHAKLLLAADAPTIVVRSRGSSGEFEALALVRRAGYALRRLTVGPAAGERDGPAVDPAEPDHTTDDVQVLAVRRGSDGTGGRRQGWTFAPGIDGALEPGDEAVVAGPEESIETYVEAIGR